MRGWAEPFLLVVAVALVYSSSLYGPFLFDDPASIIDNPTIRHLWPPGPLFMPPGGGATVGGRPLLNLSLALNYAAGGLSVVGYHAVNVAIHACGAVTLFGIIRRTLRICGAGAEASSFSFGVTLLWACHPLQTESVTYVIQRAESLMGLFYLLTLYFFIRYRVDARRTWGALCLVACAAGMATKEVMVSAPVILLLYERTFFSASLPDAWRRHRPLWGGLAVTWILLAGLVISSHDRGGTAGFGTWIPAWMYWVTQFPALLRYLGLVIWPHPLVFDYGFDRFWVTHPSHAILHVCAGVTLLAGTAVAVWRGRVAGFIGAWFFAVLAPTAIMPGTRQTMAEHRMYLALAPLALGIALVAHRWRPSSRPRPAIAAFVLIAAAFGTLAWIRNLDYRSEVRIWTTTTAAAPDNPFAWNSLGSALHAAGRGKEAVPQFRRALAVYPEYTRARANLGAALIELGQTVPGEAELNEALRARADDPETWRVAGSALELLGRHDEAAADFARAVALQPFFPTAEFSWGSALFAAGDAAGARDHFLRALQQRPEFPEALNNLGNSLAQLGAVAESIEIFRSALRLRPEFADCHNNLAISLAELGRNGDAEQEFRRALASDPAAPAAHSNYGALLQKLGRIDEARREYEEALRLNPQYESARRRLVSLPSH